jgi:hypothetical protein
MKRSRKTAKKALLAAGALLLSSLGAGVAYAYETCPAICSQNCETYYCEFQQWLADCARRVCE